MVRQGRCRCPSLCLISVHLLPPSNTASLGLPSHQWLCAGVTAPGVCRPIGWSIYHAGGGDSGEISKKRDVDQTCLEQITCGTSAGTNGAPARFYRGGRSSGLASAAKRDAWKLCINPAVGPEKVGWFLGIWIAPLCTWVPPRARATVFGCHGNARTRSKVRAFRKMPAQLVMRGHERHAVNSCSAAAYSENTVRPQHCVSAPEGRLDIK
ncbi:hypothetical protein GGX14DRAFT_399763 [Mycena pura]|uniref:Uncharacterized protein n=1 Tax=Mycena pura TaxID=153505 RepID=A0AAD6Y6G8_9AGAR|nr:hypothetical protein GGX14DRAFT_399763 [Mycena pura]